VHAVKRGGWHTKYRLTVHRLRGPVVRAPNGALHAAFRGAQEEAYRRADSFEERHFHVVRVDEGEDLSMAESTMAPLLSKQQGNTYSHLSGPCKLGPLDLGLYLRVPSGIHTDALAMLVDVRPAQRRAIGRPAHATECTAEDCTLDCRCTDVTLDAEQCGLYIGELTAVRETDQTWGPEPDVDADEEEDQTEVEQRIVYHVEGRDGIGEPVVRRPGWDAGLRRVGEVEQHGGDDQSAAVPVHQLDGEPPPPREVGRVGDREERLPPDAGGTGPVEDDGIVVADCGDLAVRIDVPERGLVSVIHVVPGLVQRNRERTQVALEEHVGVVGEG
jgi:hypothetical protein